MHRLALALESLGAVDPSRGHPGPGRLAFAVTREFRHPLAFHGMFEKFIAGVHRPVLLRLRLRVRGAKLFDLPGAAAKLLGALGKPQPAHRQLAPGRSLLERHGTLRQTQTFARPLLVGIKGHDGVFPWAAPFGLPLSLCGPSDRGLTWA
jgi:hypothetical protein